jgi:hypothetical protein
MLTNRPELHPLAGYLTGLPANEIIKVREDPNGALVVIDLTGFKHTFDASVYRAGARAFANPLKPKARFVTVEACAVRARPRRPNPIPKTGVPS